VFKFGDIKAVEHFENKFYILANRLNDTIGQYLFYIDDELSKDSAKTIDFVIKQENKLCIGDGSINISRIVSKQDGDPEEVL